MKDSPWARRLPRLPRGTDLHGLHRPPRDGRRLRPARVRPPGERVGGAEELWAGGARHRRNIHDGNYSRPPMKREWISKQSHFPFPTPQARRTERAQIDSFWLGRIATEPKHKRTIFA